MFTKLSSEKISSTECQGLRKEQKLNSDVYQIECRKGNADYYHTTQLKKRRAKRTKAYILFTSNFKVNFIKIQA